MRLYIRVSFICLFLLFGAGQASAYEMVEGEASLVLKSDGASIEAPGIATEISTVVNGTIARTKVIHYFANHTAHWQEGIYMYPIPDSAVVDRLVMVVGDRRILGFVAEKQKAREIYEQAKQEGKATSLVEKHDGNIFKTNVANIPPQSIIAIETEYQQDIDIEGQKFSLRIPMAVTPRYDHFNPEDFLTLAFADQTWSPDIANAAKDVYDRISLFDFDDGNNPVNLNVSINAGFETEKPRSTSHKIKVSEASEGKTYKIKTDRPVIKGKRDFILEWEPKDKTVPLSFVHSEAIGQYIYSQIVIVAPEKDEQPAVPLKRQVTFVIDISGSMAGPSLKQAKSALIEAIEDLNEGDYFNVISFESEIDWLFDDTVMLDSSSRKKAIKWVAALEDKGGTEMLPAAKRALEETPREGYLRQVVFITDGAIGYGDQLGDFIRRNVGNARFHAVGIGAAPNESLMRLIARQGRGSATFISDISDTEEVMGELFRKMKNPALTDVTVVLPKGLQADIVPSKLPDLLAGDPIVVAMRSRQWPDTLEVTAQRLGKDWHTSLDTSNHEAAEGVGKVYAARRVDELRYQDPYFANNVIKAEAVSLGIEHQFVTEVTSLVAVDERILRSQDDMLVTKRYSPNTPESWELAHFDGRRAADAYDMYLMQQAQDAESLNQQNEDMNLPQTALNWSMQLFIGMLMMLSAMFMLIGSGGRNAIRFKA